MISTAVTKVENVKNKRLQSSIFQFGVRSCYFLYRCKLLTPVINKAVDKGMPLCVLIPMRQRVKDLLLWCRHVNLRMLLKNLQQNEEKILFGPCRE